MTASNADGSTVAVDADADVRHAAADAGPRRGRPVWDDDGRAYIDLVAGIAVNALGHAHPRWSTP